MEFKSNQNGSGEQGVALPRLVRPLRWDHPTYYPVRCHQCGWEGMSDETAGGNQIADTGDYDECVCPKCIAPDGDYEKGEWHPVADIPESNTKI